MKTIDIPNYKRLEIKNIVFDYNGTLANGGKVANSTKELLCLLAKEYKLYVITADTFGSVKEELKDFDIEVVILSSSDHTKEKSEFIKKVNPNHTVALGNGNNDRLMLQAATLSIAIIAREGCSVSTLNSADIACTKIDDAIDILLNSKKLIATLRR
jgi:soluble P-type ATPase